MYKLVILPAANNDIKESADWYESKRKGLGKRFIFQVRQKLLMVKKSPLIYATNYDSVKTAILNVFPFMIHYVVDERHKVVVISAVLHTSRNPDLWKKQRDDIDVND